MKLNTKEFKERLEEEKKMLEEEMHGLGILNPETNVWEAVPEEAITQEADENDVADRAEGYEERTAMLHTFEDKLQAIDKALNAIAKGKYGICEVCGKPIEEKRLEANPSAATCMEHINE